MQISKVALTTNFKSSAETCLWKVLTRVNYGCVLRTKIYVSKSSNGLLPKITYNSYNYKTPSSKYPATFRSLYYKFTNNIIELKMLFLTHIFHKICSNYWFQSIIYLYFFSHLLIQWNIVQYFNEFWSNLRVHLNSMHRIELMFTSHWKRSYWTCL